MHVHSLNGEWQLFQADQPEPIPAQVPGVVHTALLAAGKLADPFYRDQERDQMWIGETDWRYCRAFTVPADLLQQERVLLRCHGLDTIATLTLNGAIIAQTNNMYRTYEFDVKALLHEGQNTLEVLLASPAQYARKMDSEKGAMTGWVEPMRTNSGGWIRKQPSNYGWDWGPMMLTSGIWRNIELVAFNSARLTDVHIVQNHTPEAVTLTVNLALETLAAEESLADVRVLKDGQLVAQAQMDVHHSGTLTLPIPNPELWWPVGLGEQPLYTVTVTLFQLLTHAELPILDQVTKTIGLRTITLARDKDDSGEGFAFACNGVRFFAKGANWIPASAYPAAATAADYWRLVQAAVDANMNMLRVWGGGIYEEAAFYDACDALGIVVWQDFMFACGTYPSRDQDFMANVTQEAIQNIQHIRHHACLGLWCGNNEIEAGLATPSWKAVMNWDDYALLFDDLLPKLVAQYDPQTAYWPGSPHTPYGNREDHNNPDYGDTHLWEVWHGRKPFEWYRTRPDRFISEFGFQSFPLPQTIEEFTLPDDRNITSYVMEHHQRSHIGNGTIIAYLLDWFQMPNTFESLVWLSQILQGMAMKYAVEHWRRNMPRTMGTLYWQLNDMWPAPSWSSLDWRGNWKALHYMARRFYAPVLVSGVEDVSSGTVAVYITSDRLQGHTGELRWTVSQANGTLIEAGVLPVNITAQTSEQVLTLNVTAHLAQYSARDVLAWLDLWINGEQASYNLVLFSRPKHLKLAMPTIRTAFAAVGDGTFTVTLNTDRPALYTWLALEGAQFSDNFIDLHPAHPVTVTIQHNGLTFDELQASLQVRSLVNTF